MAGLFILSRSVGRGGANLPPEVAKIGDALTELGPERGGVYGPPLSNEGLAQAIEQFQRFHKLKADGRIDPGGATLRTVNGILRPGQQAPGSAPKAKTGGYVVKRMAAPSGRPTSVGATTFSPQETSFVKDRKFEWKQVTGSGTIHFFEIEDKVVPNWFAAVVPNGVTPGGDVTLFFHPTPGQAGYKDANYPTKNDWSGVFHYTSENFAAQFCAAKTGQVLIMPLMTDSSMGDCGILSTHWDSIFGQILAMLAAGPSAQTAAARPVDSVSVTSFSSGIVYNAAFRNRAALGSRLRGIVDIDGIISTAKQHSLSLPARAIKLWQTHSAGDLAALERQNIFPINVERWSGPWEGKFPKDPYAALMAVHGTAPQQMMYFATRRAIGR